MFYQYAQNHIGPFISLYIKGFKPEWCVLVPILEVIKPETSLYCFSGLWYMFKLRLKLKVAYPLVNINIAS